MRKLGVVLIVALVASSCRGGSDSGPQTRTVRVDYASDEFASVLFAYFPLKVTVRPGDTVAFKQTWTGEPHTVTMGRMVDKAFKVFAPLIERFRKGEEVSDEEIESPPIKAASEPLPEFFAGEDELGQNAAQPCYLETGAPPKDPKQACAKRAQPEFNGRQTYYNSGFIPYGGPRGNQFTVKLARDIKPGTYTYYCNVHGPPMSGQIQVKPAGSSIPSEDEVNEEAFKQIERKAAPLRRALDRAKRTGRWSYEGASAQGNFAGLFVPKVFGGLNEFVPKNIKARVGSKVTWSVIGFHTISFKVPPYFPIFTIAKDGAVAFNKRAEEPAGGAPPPPPEPSNNGPPEEAPAAGQKGPPAPKEIDGGAWDGSRFWSTGTVSGEPYLKYSLTFTKRGRYEYACLIHPKMVGTVTVT